MRRMVVTPSRVVIGGCDAAVAVIRAGGFGEGMRSTSEGLTPTAVDLSPARCPGRPVRTPPPSAVGRTRQPNSSASATAPNTRSTALVPHAAADAPTAVRGAPSLLIHSIAPSTPRSSRSGHQWSRHVGRYGGHCAFMLIRPGSNASERTWSPALEDEDWSRNSSLRGKCRSCHRTKQQRGRPAGEIVQKFGGA